MMKILISLLAGVLFGIGLALSKMIDPNKVLNFLDVTGNWDPSLAFVMLGALLIGMVGFHFIPKRKTPLLEDKFRLPTRTDIDKPLVLGAVLFGVGWGIAGFCPGPAIASLAIGSLDPLIFVIFMTVGILLHGLIYEKK